MRRSTCLLITILASSLCNRAKATLDTPPLVWEKTFGGSNGDEGWSVQQTADGGFVIAGGTSSFGAGGQDVYLVKTDSAGNLFWQKTFGGSSWDSAHSVEQTTDGGFIIAGYTGSFGAGNDDVYLIKTDPNGEMLWQNTFGGSKWEYGYSVQQTTDGGFIIAGDTSSFSAWPYSDVYLVKTDCAGNLLWQKTIGGGHFDFGTSVQQTADGGYIIAGWTKSFGGAPFREDVYLIKTNSAGNLLWQKTFIVSVSWAAVQQTTDGGYIIVAGSTLIKTDTNGNLLWQKTFGGFSCGFSCGSSIQQTIDRGFIIAGCTSSFSADPDYTDVYLVKTDSEGNLLWQKTFAGSRENWGRSVQQTADGGYIMAGWTESFGAGSSDVYLIKLGFEGCQRWDFNCDRLLDFADFAEFAEHWLENTPP